ncbi:uncharacterized protein LOC142238924 [Haematobia irritans]|uniref:uncharacterized protein LOC142238924 n=1 Tax=Haematobia irritans TaxID=7368 RepID=UPI003F50C078
MEKKLNSIVMSRILDILNESPDTSELIDNLYEMVKDYIPKTVQKTISKADLEKSFKKALEAAKEFGLIVVDEETAKLAFKFGNGNETTLAPSRNLSNAVSNNSEPDDEVYAESTRGRPKMALDHTDCFGRGRSSMARSSSRRRRTRRSARREENKADRSRSRSTRRYRRTSRRREE